MRIFGPLKSSELRSSLFAVMTFPVRKGHRGPAADYSLKEFRHREQAAAELVERGYERFVSNWKPKKPAQTARAY
jgi:hypothetical protein